MLLRVTFVTDITEESIASIIRVTRIGVLGTLLVFICNVLRLIFASNVVSSSAIPVTLMMEAVRSSETSVLIRATGHNIPGDGILQ
jgi:hypothetical protein